MQTDDKYIREFSREPMIHKDVTDIDGVNEQAAVQLRQLNFTKAYHLLGQFLVLDKDEEMFKSWLEDEITNLTQYNIHDIYITLRDWCIMNL